MSALRKARSFVFGNAYAGALFRAPTWWRPGLGRADRPRHLVRGTTAPAAPPAARGRRTVRGRVPRRRGPWPRLGLGPRGLPGARLGRPRLPARVVRRAAAGRRASAWSCSTRRARRLRPRPGRPARTHGVEFGKALDAVFARFGPAEAVVAHSLGAISTYLTLRFGWLSTRPAGAARADGRRRPAVRPVPAGARFRRPHPRAFDRHLEEFVGIPMAEFDAVSRRPTSTRCPRWSCTTAATARRRTPTRSGSSTSLPDARLVTTDGLGHRRILRTGLSSGGRDVPAR